MVALTLARKTELTRHIGNTPLVRLRRIWASPAVRIYAKLEWFNPGGSVKDRPAWNMIRQGEKSGLLGPGKTIVDATSGNTGIAYAMIGATRGYRVKLVMPSNASSQRKRILRSYGAELVLTDPLEGSDRAIQQAREIAQSSPSKYFYPDQYNNDANWQAHYHGTAMEIYRELGHHITHFVAGRGTTGTLVGNSRRLKELKPSIQTATFTPESPFHGLEGIKHLPSSQTPGIYDDSLVDEEFAVSTEEAQEMTGELARREGLFAGTSSGAAMVAARRTAEKLQSGTLVVIFPDGGDRYLGEGE